MEAPARILIIMLRRIGDVLLTTPAVRALRKLYPRAQIDFLAESPCHQLLEGNPDISQVLVYERASNPIGGLLQHARWMSRVRRARYDWVIDYMGNPRSALVTALSGAAVRAGPAHVAHRWAYSHPLVQSPATCYAAREKIRVLRSLGVSPDEDDCLPKIKVREESRLWAEEVLKQLENPLTLPSHPKGERDRVRGPLIGFAPASRKATRRWPAASYAGLGRVLRQRCGARILVLWGPGEESLAQEVAQGIGGGATPAPRTRTLHDLAALVAHCRLIVTNCNGPKHVAVALGVPTLTIHGSSDPAAWNPPDSPRHRIIRLDELFCIGCRLNTCPYKLECMRNLSPERVAREAQEMLNALVA